jgi:hypothetical protein
MIMKMKWAMCLLVGLLAFATNVCAEPDPNFYIFLCFGQSNMEGYASFTTPPDNGIEEQDKTVDKRFQVFATVDFKKQNRKKGNWYPAVPPLCRENTGLCPVDYFGRTMVANLPENVRVGVINVAIGGCSIELFDKDNYEKTLSTAAGWLKNTAKAYDSNPYQHLVEAAKLAQKDGVIKGILLHQGESNNGDKQWPNKVKGIYDNLMKDLNLKPESVPLLAGGMVPADQKGACAGMNSLIEKELPKTLPNSYFIPSTNCGGRPDHLHFTPAGYRELGKRYGEKMLSLLGVKVKEEKKDESKDKEKDSK